MRQITDEDLRSLEAIEWAINEGDGYPMDAIDREILDLLEDYYKDNPEILRRVQTLQSFDQNEKEDADN